MTSVRKIRIGEVISQRREKYDGTNPLPIRGVTRDGFVPPKQKDADTSLYNVFYKNDFVFNPARMELNSISFNRDIEKGICSSLYEVFYVSRPDIILPEYLNIFVKRDEFARKCWFNAIGSARNYFRVSDLAEFEIDIPSLEVQRKYADIYEALLLNLRAHEAGLEDLKLVCDSFIEHLRHTIPLSEIGPHIFLLDFRNKNGLCTNVKSVSIQKSFNEVGAKVNRANLYSYKIVPPQCISYVQTTGNEKCFAFAINDTDEDILVTSVNNVFRTDLGLNPYYLGLWFRRKEFDRYARFISWGSARETVSWEDLCRVRIPIPKAEIQDSIVAFYSVLAERIKKRDKLKRLLSEICPLLIRGSIEEAAHS